MNSPKRIRQLGRAAAVWCKLIHWKNGQQRGLLVAVLVCLLAGTVATFCTASLSTFTFTKAFVQNTSDRNAFSTKRPPGFINQKVDSKRLNNFRKYVSAHTGKSPGSLDKAISLRRWARDQQSDNPEAWLPPYLDDSEDPESLLGQQRQGYHSACRRFSYILTGALLSEGFDARVVYASEDFLKNGQHHTLVEVWIEDLRKWVLLDPTLDTLILVNGIPASLLEIFSSVSTNPDMHLISFRRDGSPHKPAPTLAAYKKIFRHIFIANTNAIFDGYGMRLFGTKRISFLHFSGDGIESYPQVKKEFLLICGMVSAVAFALSGLTILPTLLRKMIPLRGR